MRLRDQVLGWRKMPTKKRGEAGPGGIGSLPLRDAELDCLD